MGWAKYHEDVVSRLTGDRFMWGAAPPRHAAPLRQTPAKTESRKQAKMSSLKQFAVTAPRPLPVIVLADGPWSEGKFIARTSSTTTPTTGTCRRSGRG